MITVILDPVIGINVSLDGLYSLQPPVTIIQNLSFEI